MFDDMEIIDNEMGEVIVNYRGYYYIREYDCILEIMTWYLYEYNTYVGEELHLELEEQYQKLIKDNEMKQSLDSKIKELEELYKKF